MFSSSSPGDFGEKLCDATHREIEDVVFHLDIFCDKFKVKHRMLPSQLYNNTHN